MQQAQLARIVGEKNVLTKPALLEEYSRDMSFVRPVRPACILKPENADQVKKIVNAAKQKRTPLVPVSSGGPHFRGDTVPSTGGAMVVDLSEMKKIIHIDARTAWPCSSRGLLSAS
jgi:FAD/FMN-containing dehydrogenase